MATRIQNLIHTWPQGAVRAVSALRREGYSLPLLAKYKQSSWLASIGEGALIRSGDTPSLFGGLYALQHDLRLNVHLGALTALELLGRAHYLREHSSKFWIFGETKRLPKWFTHYDWKGEIHYCSTQLFPYSEREGIEEYQYGSFRVFISSELRAIFEVLSLVPQRVSLEEGRELVLGLNAAHPKSIMKLLHVCRSIKVKRLFLALSDLAGHQWVEKINLSNVNLGTGSRTFVSGGRLHSKFGITLPKSFYSEAEG
jgi:hypothetical protein